MGATDRHLGQLAVCLALLAAGCGAKTGLETPLPPPCEIPPPVVPEVCNTLSLGAPQAIGGTLPIRRIVTHGLERGVWTLLRGEALDRVVLLGADARPLGPVIDVSTPFDDALSALHGAADGCLPVMSLGTFRDSAPAVTPGRCAFLPMGADLWTFLPGTYDRCLVLRSDTSGIEFSLTRGGREVHRRVGLDGSFVDREAAAVGEGPALGALPSLAGPARVDFVPGRLDAPTYSSA